MWRSLRPPLLIVDDRCRDFHGITEKEPQQIDQVRPQVGVYAGSEEYWLAEGTADEFLLDQLVRRHAAIVVVHAEGPAGAPRSSHHVFPDRNRMRHDFFAQYMASGFER